MVEKKPPMTVAQLRAALDTFADDDILTFYSWDSDAMYTYQYGIDRITPEGTIIQTLIGGWHDSEAEDAGSFEVEEELEAEAETAEAEDAATLYHDESAIS